MSWLQKRPDISEEAWKCLGFKPKSGCGFSIERAPNTADKAKKRQLAADEEWRNWLDEDLHCTSPESHRINLILGGRAVRPWGHDPMILSQLPWSKPIFSHIATRFMVHSQILTAINRNTSCLFSFTETTLTPDGNGSPVRAWIYNCRSSSLWPNDMALSVTFLPDSRTTHAVLFGCDQTTPDKYDPDMTLGDIITSRLAASDTPFAHPMLLPTIFADVERDRQIELVRDETAKLGERIQKLASFTAERESMISSTGTTRKSGSSEKTEESSAMIWLSISKLRNGLGDWQRQLYQMIEHVDEIHEKEFAVTKSGGVQSPGPGGIFAGKNVQLARQEGARIRERLQELVDEYDQYIRECTHIMDGMSLATQLELSSVSHMDSQTNLEVAQLTRRDGNLMKSIATLGMIFLPATFVTAFFSMGFFDWGDETMSRYIWVYVVAVLVTTLVTVSLFYCLILRRWKQPRSPVGSV